MVDGNAPVPLKHREVRSEVYCDVGVAETLETLSYVADKDCSVRFKFPLPPRSSVFRCAGLYLFTACALQHSHCQVVSQRYNACRPKSM